MTVGMDRNMKKQEYVPTKKLSLTSFKSVPIIVSCFVYSVKYLSVKGNVWIMNYKFLSISPKIILSLLQ